MENKKIDFKKNKKYQMNCNINEKEGVTFLTFPLFEKNGLKHGFSTRLGGVSEGGLSSMNLSFSRGDKKENVITNHKRFANAVGYDVENLVFTRQTHTNNVRRVYASDCGKGYSRETDFVDVDGLITNEKNVVLMTFFADCVPLYFYDPVNQAIGASHSGWAGTVKRIGLQTIKKMGEEFGSRPEDILVVVGPSICQDCYEVSEDVALKFMDEFDEKQHSQILIDKGNGKYQLDLWKANEIILKEAGIKEENLQISAVCTRCNHDTMFSHRYAANDRGNLAGMVTLS